MPEVRLGGTIERGDKCRKTGNALFLPCLFVALRVAEGLQAQQMTHPQLKLGAVDRLGEEFFRPCIESGQPRRAVDLRRDHDDRDVGRGGIALRAARNFMAISPGIMTSKRIRSGARCSIIVSALSPLLADSV